MNKTKIIRPDGSEFILELKGTWGDIGKLCKFHGEKFYTVKGWYVVYPLNSIEMVPGVHEILLEEKKILMWRWSTKSKVGGNFYVGIDGNCEIWGETREEAERKLKLLAFE